MSDVKRFTGFIAIDGSTHTSEKLAVIHSRGVKIKAALKEKFAGLIVMVDGVPEGTENPKQGLELFLFENMAEIMSAFNQEVLTRKKRTLKVKPAVTTTTPEVVA
jgi:hypothetical protein